MPGYQYIAYDLDGREQRGVLESDSARLARASLRERGLFPLDVTLIEAANDASAGSVSSGGLRRLFAWNTRPLPSAELARLTRQLATLIGAGLTIEQTFNALVDQSETENERQMLASIRGAVLEGQSLSQALAAYPSTFSELYRTLVNAGESSGRLGDVLMRLADYVEEQQAIKQKLMVAMIYPTIVLTICIAVVVGLMIYVVPQVVGVFTATKQTLPFMTRALLALSAFLQKTWWLWMIAGVAGAFFYRWAMQREPHRRRWHLLLLRVPVLGRMLRTRDAAQLSSTLSILVGSGVPVLHALNAAAGVVGLLPVREALQRATAQVRDGIALSTALKAQQGSVKLFPPVMIHLIASGEASGRLTVTLDSASRQQQRELETRTAAIAALIEPVMIVFMGAVVLAIVLAILLPIFELNQLVAR